MLKQQTVSTTMGQLTVSSLTLGELRQLDALFKSWTAQDKGVITPLLNLLPVIFGSVRKVHQDVSLEQLENGLTFEDLDTLFSAVMDVSGLKRAPAGEPVPVPV